MKYNKKLLFGLTLIALIILIIIISSNKSKTLLECKSSDYSQHQSYEVVLKIYKQKNKRFYDNVYTLSYDEEYSKYYSKAIDDALKNKDEYDNIDGLKYKISNENNQVKVHINADLSILSEDYNIKLLKYNYANSSIEDIYNYLTKEGNMQCKKY